MTPPEHRTQASPNPWALVPAMIAGWAIIGFGIHSALRNRIDANPSALLQHVIAFDLGHDLVIAPVAVALGWLIGRVVPHVARGPVRAAMAATALTVVFSYPLIEHWGKRPTNSSAVPLDYGRNLAIVIAIVWLLAVVVVVGRIVADRSQHAEIVAQGTDVAD